MKTKYHYVLVKTRSVISRTYGGEQYTLDVYRNNGPGKFQLVGNVHANTRGHKGRTHEAWSQVIQKDLPKAVLKRVLKTDMPGSSGPRNYHPHSITETHGIYIQDLG